MRLGQEDITCLGLPRLHGEIVSHEKNETKLQQNPSLQVSSEGTCMAVNRHVIGPLIQYTYERYSTSF